MTCLSSKQYWCRFINIHISEECCNRCIGGMKPYCKYKLYEFLKLRNDKFYIFCEKVKIDKFGKLYTLKPCMQNIPNCSVFRKGIVAREDSVVVVFDFICFEPSFLLSKVCRTLDEELPLFDDFYFWLNDEWRLNMERPEIKVLWAQFLYSKKMPVQVPADHWLTISVYNFKNQLSKGMLDPEKSLASYIQSSTSKIIKDKFNKLSSVLPYGNEIMFTVHDELLISCERESIETVLDLGRKVLEEPVSGMQFKVNNGVGESWYDAKQNIKKREERRKYEN